MEKPKIIVVLGQTSTGKSDFAVSLAKQLKKTGIKSEIISADSRQVYKGMNLLSGKITSQEMGGISHHMIDVISPKKVFSVSDYKKKADAIIKKLTNENIVPIIAGGTGFYIDAVAHGAVLPQVAPNKELRAKLERKSAEELFALLKKKDPGRAKNIDAKNKVRLVRAIEIATALGKVSAVTHELPYEVLTIGLTLSDVELRKRIHTRLLKRMKQGMMKEAEGLHSAGVSWKRMNELGLEARYCALYLENKITKKEMLDQLEGAIWKYAKRQKTWFKRDKEIVWIKPKVTKEIISLVKNFISKTSN